MKKKYLYIIGSVILLSMLGGWGGISLHRWERRRRVGRN